MRGAACCISNLLLAKDTVSHVGHERDLIAMPVTIPKELRHFIQCDPDGGYDRTLIEFCCGASSLIRQRRPWTHGCRIVRITEELDARSMASFTLLSCVTQCKPCLWWISMPCTGGTPWTHINKYYPRGYQLIREHVRLLRQLLAVLEEFVDTWIRHGTYIAIEWPRDCTYWKRNDVISLINRLQLKEANFHGCYFGLTSVIDPSRFMKKPWKLLTNCEPLYRAFNGCLCPKTHEHAECRGKDAKASENYNEHIVKLIHKSFRQCL